ncbi:hypothetical protein [Streptomyces sp. NPDC000880]
MLINLATVLTVLLVVLTIFLALLLITSMCAITLISESVIEDQLHRRVGITTYLEIAWAVASLAMHGGAGRRSGEQPRREGSGLRLPSQRAERASLRHLTAKPRRCARRRRLCRMIFSVRTVAMDMVDPVGGSTVSLHTYATYVIVLLCTALYPRNMTS